MRMSGYCFADTCGKSKRINGFEQSNGFDPGVDSKTMVTQTPMTSNADAAAGSASMDESTGGTQVDEEADANSGLSVTDTSDGQKTTMITQLNVPEGSKNRVAASFIKLGATVRPRLISPRLGCRKKHRTRLSNFSNN